MKTKFFTGKGDGGESEIGKKKIPKNDPAMALLGSLDELNSWLGFCRSRTSNEADSSEEGSAINISELLKELQQMLFIAQAEVAATAFEYSKGPKIMAETTKRIETTIEAIDGKLGELRNFIIPGGHEISAMLDFGRTIARRAERDAVYYHSETKKLAPELLRLLNRFSSLLFALARYVNYQKGIEEDKPSY